MELPITSVAAPQTKSIGSFIEMADSMSAALAADDLAKFNSASKSAMQVTGELIDELRSVEGASETLDALDKVRHLHGFDDISLARIAFHQFSVAATAVLEPLRMAKGMPDFDVWECSMVDQAIPGAPKRGRWLQSHGRAGENPFFGEEMLNCAKEIKRGGEQP